MPTYIIKQRGDTAAAWDIANPVLAEREVGWILDSEHLACKIGDGVTPWKRLPVRTGPQGPAGDSNMMLSDSVSSTASAVAASSKAVKTAYDKAVEAAAKGRIRLTANITVYARITGNDNNDGLTPETAKRSGNAARSLLKNYDLNGYTFNIDLGDGFFDEDLIIHSYNMSACDIVVTGAGIGKTRVRLIQSRAKIVYVQNLSAQLNVNFDGIMFPRNVEAVPYAAGQDCCDAYAGVIQLAGPMTISSPVDRRGYLGVKAAYGGTFITNNHPITYSEDTEFTSSGFCSQGASSTVDLGTTVYSGSFVGRKVYGLNDGKMSISGNNFEVIPGSLPAYFNDRTATTSLIGKVQLATTVEAIAGTDKTKPVTPEGLKAAIETIQNSLLFPSESDSRWVQQATYTTNQSITVPATVDWVKAVVKGGKGNDGSTGGSTPIAGRGGKGGAGGYGEVAVKVFSAVAFKTLSITFGVQGNGNSGASGSGYGAGAGGSGGLGVQIANLIIGHGGGGGGGGGGSDYDNAGSGGAGGGVTFTVQPTGGYTLQQAGAGASNSTGGNGGAGLTFTNGNTSATPSCTLYYINK